MKLSLRSIVLSSRLITSCSLSPRTSPGSVSSNLKSDHRGLPITCQVKLRRKQSRFTITINLYWYKMSHETLTCWIKSPPLGSLTAIHLVFIYCSDFYFSAAQFSHFVKQDSLKLPRLLLASQSFTHWQPQWLPNWHRCKSTTGCSYSTWS